MHANFQDSRSTGVGGGGGDRHKDRCHAIFGSNQNEISKLLSRLLGRDQSLLKNTQLDLYDIKLWKNLL